jgi:hypothetical protein
LKITARIIHNGTESTFTGHNDELSTRFFLTKMLEWTQGRRDGELECNADQGRLLVAFADISLFAVEVQA